MAPWTSFAATRARSASPIPARTPGDPCGDNYDCPPGEFCEPTLNNCIGQDENVECEVTPTGGVFNPTIEWDYTAEEVVATPLVADIDNDGVQEVIINTTRVNFTGTDAIGWWRGEIAVLNGDTGAVEFTITENPPTSFGSHGRSTPAVGDVSGDGIPDIIYAGRADETGGATFRHSIVHAVDHNGTLLWSSNDGPTNGYAPHDIEVSNGAPTLANFDNDDNAEVVIGATLIDHNGTVVWDAGDGGTYGSPASYTGGISAVADLNNDGQPEIISGRHAWQVDTSLNVSTFWEADLGNDPDDDGFPAVADLDQDGTPEVVIVANGMLHIRNGITGNLWCAVGNCQSTPLTAPIAIAGGGRGGPPTIADFDGDGRPEIGIAGANRYAVYDIYRNGETVVYPGGNPAPNLGEVYARWESPTQDESSNSTGSSVFDFEGRRRCRSHLRRRVLHARLRRCHRRHQVPDREHDRNRPRVPDRRGRRSGRKLRDPGSSPTRPRATRTVPSPTTRAFVRASSSTVTATTSGCRRATCGRSTPTTSPTPPPRATSRPPKPTTGTPPST